VARYKGFGNAPTVRELRTFEDPHSRGEVVDSSGGLQRSSQDGGRGDQIVCEGVVEITLLETNNHASISHLQDGD
jgi:hypothetical protein